MTTHPSNPHAHTNALARETSPYLLQHAHNPVDWHAWGPGAFEKARKLGKPIFLSIGYSTCYWCHVMERQCFENGEIAALMNEHFVNIKVDREERPDVDDVYMLAVQIMTGHGGWPMSVFLTHPGSVNPDDRGLEPFYAGTYFPPEPMHGRPSFPQVLLALSDAWKNKRSDVLAQAAQTAESVAEHLGRVDPAGELSVDLIATAANRLLRSYDAEHGGFGGAPKFPTPSNLFLLMEVYANNRHEDVWKALAHTFDRMARGGMYDQIGGGFHRYSTDEKWLVPHFEKMLYDNGQLVEAYLIAQSIHPDAHEPGLYPRVVRQTCDYVIREMTDASGAYWSARDAEVDTLEGGNYLWKAGEVAEVLSAVKDPHPNPLPGAAGTPLGEGKMLALEMYGLNLGANFQDPHHQEVPPSNVLFLPKRLDEVAKEQGISLDALLKAKQKIDETLRLARDKRKQPGTDDKVLTAWNGMMIAGMARAGSDLREPKYLASAARTARAILKTMRSSDGGLLRTMRKNVAKIPGFLDDYAFFVHGLLALHRANENVAWLEAAVELTQLAQEKFAVDGNRGGYFDTLADQPDLFVRTRSTYDGAIPSANSQMVHNLIDLFELTGDGTYLDRAMLDLRSFADAMRRNPSGMARMQQALLRAAGAAPERMKGQTIEATTQGGKRQVVSLEVDGSRVDLSSGRATVKLTLRIGPDYHLNAHEAGAEGLIPTKLELQGEPSLALEVKYPEPTTKKFPFADRAIDVYEGVVMIEATLRKTGKGTPPPEVKLVLSYQVCTDMSCLEPRTTEVVVRIG